MQDLNSKLIAAGALKKPGKHQRTKIAVKNPNNLFFFFNILNLSKSNFVYFTLSLQVPNYKSGVFQLRIYVRMSRVNLFYIPVFL